MLELTEESKRKIRQALFDMPRELRDRYWRETEFGKYPHRMSRELFDLIMATIKPNPLESVMPIQPTPTQAENDAAHMGNTPNTKDDDGSGPEPTPPPVEGVGDHPPPQISSKPTPTQDENDQAGMGNTPPTHEDDGSASVDQGQPAGRRGRAMPPIALTPAPKRR